MAFLVANICLSVPKFLFIHINLHLRVPHEKMQLRKLLVLLVVFGFVAAAFAHDGPESEGPHASEGPESDREDDGVEREFKYAVEADKIEVEVKMKENGTESKLKHKIEANDNGVEFRVAYQQESGNTETELRLRVRLFQLVEYIPDSTPGYQNETIVNSYSEWNWGSGFQDTTTNSNTQKVITLKTADGIFTLVLRVNAPLDASGLSFKPEDVKFDIELDADAMRSAGWLNGTEVALRASLASRLETEKEHDDDDKQTQNAVNVGAPSDFSGLYMSWVNYLQCDNNKVSVVSSPLRRDDSQRESDDDSDSTAHVVSFAFINLGEKSNSACIWDPVVGVATAKAGSAATIVASWVAIVAAFFALF